MAKFPNRSSSEEESSSWVYTVLGMLVIFCVVGFIGFAKPSGEKSSTVANELEVPKFQVLEQIKPGQASQSELPVASLLVPQKKEEKIKLVELPRFPENVLEDQGLFVSLPFGGDAKGNCAKNCNQEPSCLISCGRLLPDTFARRILPQELDHKSLAAKAVQSCKSACFINQIPPGRRAEVKMMLVPVEYFEEVEISKKVSEASMVMQNLTTAKDADPLAESVCYYQASLVSGLAAAKAVKSRDSVSELAYLEYEAVFVEALKRKLQEIRG